MDLIFLGRGSSNYTKQGNNAAYFIENGELFLIDCGETIFSKLMEKKLLETVDEINVMITHTHCDHIGSLGSLILYCYFTLQKNVHIILPDRVSYVQSIEVLLKYFGCTIEMYHIVSEKELDYKYETFMRIRYQQTNHVKQLECYGILFDTSHGFVYYSGDTKEIDNVKRLIDHHEKIDKIYIDTTSLDSKDNVHVCVDTLNKEVPENIKQKVYCMHFNNDDCMEKAKKYGFHVVEVPK